MAGSGISDRLHPCKYHASTVWPWLAAVYLTAFIPANITHPQYGPGWTAKKPTRVAVFSVGWYHGFGVEMGNDLFRFRDCLRGILRNLKQMIFKKHLYVTVNGKKCRVLGHIGMLHTCVDVTKLQCAVGDTAIFDIKPLLLKGIEVVYR